MMPRKTRFKLALVLAAGGIVASGATVPADAAKAKRPPNGKTMEQSQRGLDWERTQRGE